MSEITWRDELKFQGEVDPTGIGQYLTDAVIPYADGTSVWNIPRAIDIVAPSHTVNADNSVTSSEVSTAGSGFYQKENHPFVTATESIVLVGEIYVGHQTGQSTNTSFLKLWNYSGTTFGFDFGGGYGSTLKAWGRIGYSSSIAATNITSDFPSNTRNFVALHYDPSTRMVDIYLNGIVILAGTPIADGNNAINLELSTSLGTTKDRFYSAMCFSKSGSFTEIELEEILSNPYSAFMTEIESNTDGHIVDDYTVGPTAEGTYDYASAKALMDGTRPAVNRVRGTFYGQTPIGGSFYSSSYHDTANFPYAWEWVANESEYFNGNPLDDIATIRMYSRGLALSEVQNFHVHGLKLLIDQNAPEGWSIDPRGIGDLYNTPEIRGKIEWCFFAGVVGDTLGDGVAFTDTKGDPEFIVIENCLAADLAESGFSANGQTVINSVAVNCNTSGGTGRSAAMLNNNTHFYNCVVDVPSGGNSFADHYNSKNIGSNNVTNDAEGAKFEAGQANVDFTNAYVDRLGGDFRFTEAFADTYLKGKGANGSDIASWLYAAPSAGGEILFTSASDSTSSISGAIFQQLNADALALSQSLSQSSLDLILGLISESVGQSASEANLDLGAILALIAQSNSQSLSDSNLRLILNILAQSEGESLSQSNLDLVYQLAAYSMDQSASQANIDLLLKLITEAGGQSTNSGMMYLQSPVASHSFSQAQVASSLHLVQMMVTNAPSDSDVTGLLRLLSGMDAGSVSESSAAGLVELIREVIQLSGASDSSSDSEARISFIRNLVAHSEAFLDSETLMSLMNYISTMSTTESDTVSALGVVANLFSNSDSVSSTDSLLINVFGIEANTITVSEVFGLAQLELALNGDIKAASYLAGVLEGIIDRIGYLTIDQLSVGLLLDAGINLDVVMNANVELRSVFEAELGIRKDLSAGTLNTEPAFDAASITISPKR